LHCNTGSIYIASQSHNIQVFAWLDINAFTYPNHDLHTHEKHIHL